MSCSACNVGSEVSAAPARTAYARGAYSAPAYASAYSAPAYGAGAYDYGYGSEVAYESYAPAVRTIQAAEVYEAPIVNYAPQRVIREAPSCGYAEYAPQVVREVMETYDAPCADYARPIVREVVPARSYAAPCGVGCGEVVTRRVVQEAPCAVARPIMRESYGAPCGDVVARRVVRDSCAPCGEVVTRRVVRESCAPCGEVARRVVPACGSTCAPSCGEVVTRRVVREASPCNVGCGVPVVRAATCSSGCGPRVVSQCGY